MPHYIRYEFDYFNEGYYRRGIPINRDYIQGALSGRVIAHDYVEHPRGYPTGTLEDEIAAFGVIAVTRLPAGLIGGFLGSPDLMLAEELREMLKEFREGYLPEEMLKQRKRYWKSNETILEDIADIITQDKILNKRLVAWFQYGVTKARQRFQYDYRALNLFQNIERVVNDFLNFNHHYPDFTLGINGTEAFIVNNYH